MCQKTCPQRVLDLARGLEQVLAFDQDRYEDEAVWEVVIQAVTVDLCCCMEHWYSQHLQLQIGGGVSDENVEKRQKKVEVFGIEAG